ncbi:hypothetical protein ASD77_07765 [Pseudoxanthomonas sp. Root65]|uniref:hypothetical protein n=1 Tax=Pseudoxanthomonas sp. Root65 TaxID=1736576 RepID=UPI0006FEF558|nr:hypothetical protein [Pseudoxanthomonas sp. Root65]KRA54488.1 hypothetical protein ASD77_07765 [Pseudoxanthomonas sp. Root65]
MNTTSSRAPDVLPCGLLLIASGVLAPLIMIFHPTAQGADMAARLVSLTEISSLSRHVHLAMIACIVALWLSLTHLARCWPGSGGVGAAARLYALGAVAMLGAALISGFLIGDYLQRVMPLIPHAEDALPSVLLAFSANQVLAGFGMLGMSAGIALWSVAMLRQSGPLAIACGAYGVIAGLLCLIGYAAGWIALDVTGMTFVVVAQSLWYCLLGLWVVRASQRLMPTTFSGDGPRD